MTNGAESKTGSAPFLLRGDDYWTDRTYRTDRGGLVSVAHIRERHDGMSIDRETERLRIDITMRNVATAYFFFYYFWPHSIAEREVVAR